MTKRDLRQSGRQSYAGPVEVSWVEPTGESKFVRGKCLEISDTGMRLELPIAIPLHILVSLRLSGLHLTGTGSVRHVRRTGVKYMAGLEMSQRWRDAVSAKALA